MTDTVLIVDDEETVRRTFREWLTAAMPDARVFAVPDAESALQIANEHPIDLAVLDWNLGSGSDGLRLLEDLAEFQPDVVAILVTGFAHQATPLDALRMGVRDYIDKNQDLNRDAFVASVRRQLDRIRPAKQQRELNRRLAAFREAVEKLLPIVQTSAAFNDPVPLPNAVKALLRFMIRGTRAVDGALIVRHTAPDGAESTAAYGADGEPLPTPDVPFARSLAASVVSFQEPVALNDFDPKALGPVELFPFEANRSSILAASLRVAPDTVVVVELFDKAPARGGIGGNPRGVPPTEGFTDDDRRLVTSAAEVGTDLLRQAVAERQTHKLLFDAVDAALHATAQFAGSPAPSADTDVGPPPSVLARLKEGLGADSNAVADPDTTLRLVEAVRSLAVRHGPRAVEHCVGAVNDLRKLLDELTGTA